MVTEAAGDLGDDARVRLWLDICEPLERQLRPLGHAVMDALRVASGERVLDIGCGVGRTPHDLAARVGPTGRVVGLDLLQSAIDVARRDPHLPTAVAFECVDAGSATFQPGAFDVAFSRFGVMFFNDPVTAFRNIRVGLRPGGRLGFCCWRGLDANELDSFPLNAAAAVLPASAVDATISADFLSFQDAERIGVVLHNAGFTEIDIRPHDQFVRCGDLAATVDVCTRVGALGRLIRDRPDLRPEAVQALTVALAARDGPGGPPLRAAVWVVTARA